MSSFTHVLADVMGFFIRTVVFLAGLIFLLSLVVAGTIGFGAVLLWRLLTGRRPLLPRLSDLAGIQAFGFDPRTGWSRFHGGSGWRPSRRGSEAGGDIVEAEVREIPDAPDAVEGPRDRP